MAILLPPANLTSLRLGVSGRDFAVADGVTDDTAALTAAATRAALLGYELYLPAGVYIIDGWAPPAVPIRGAGPGLTILKRKPDASALNTVTFSGKAGVELRDLTIDGDKEHQAGPGNNLVLSNCWNYKLHNIESRSAKATTGNGGGINVSATTSLDKINGTYSSATDLYCHNNDGGGARWTGPQYGLRLWNIRCNSNGGEGFRVSNATYPPSPSTIEEISLNQIEACDNASHGFVLPGYIQGGTAAAPIYGEGFDPIVRATVDNVRAHRNGRYGALIQTTNSQITNLAANNNGGTGIVYAGLCANANKTYFDNVQCDENEFYGIDCGGAVDCTFDNFHCDRNGINSESGRGTGFNYGGSVNLRGTNGRCANNGTSVGGVQFSAARYEGGGGVAFPHECARSTLVDCVATVSFSTQTGFKHSEDPFECEWINCRVTGANVSNSNAFLNQSTTSRLTNCQITGSAPYIGAGFLSGPSLTIGDHTEAMILNAAADTPINWSSIYTTTASTFRQKVLAIRMTNPGEGYTSAPEVTLTGGGGTGATARALIRNDGTICITVENTGEGYTTAPTVGITGGGGTGAAATAYITCRNFNGRTFRILFGSGGPITVKHGTTSYLIRLNGGSDWETATNDTLTLRAWLDVWREEGRGDF